MTSFIQREIDRLSAAIVDPGQANQRAELYAAQQALAWALEPSGFRSPYGAIMGIPEAPEDYQAPPHPVPSLDIRALGPF